jgi:hypothetical protein
VQDNSSVRFNISVRMKVGGSFLTLLLIVKRPKGWVVHLAISICEMRQPCAVLRGRADERAGERLRRISPAGSFAASHYGQMSVGTAT